MLVTPRLCKQRCKRAREFWRLCDEIREIGLDVRKSVNLGQLTQKIGGKIGTWEVGYNAQLN